MTIEHLFNIFICDGPGIAMPRHRRQFDFKYIPLQTVVALPTKDTGSHTQDINYHTVH